MPSRDAFAQGLTTVVKGAPDIAVHARVADAGYSVSWEAVTEEIGRERYCELVRIHRSTLSRWIAEGVLTPETAGAHERQVFSENDVRFGRALAIMLRKYRGTHALWEMVEVVRGTRRLEELREPGPTTRPNQKQAD
jgi:hypothetical protein